VLLKIKKIPFLGGSWSIILSFSRENLVIYPALLEINEQSIKSMTIWTAVKVVKNLVACLSVIDQSLTIDHSKYPISGLLVNYWSDTYSHYCCHRPIQCILGVWRPVQIAELTELHFRGDGLEHTFIYSQYKHMGLWGRTYYSREQIVHALLERSSPFWSCGETVAACDSLLALVGSEFDSEFDSCYKFLSNI